MSAALGTGIPQAHAHLEPEAAAESAASESAASESSGSEDFARVEPSADATKTLLLLEPTSGDDAAEATSDAAAQATAPPPPVVAPAVSPPQPSAQWAPPPPRRSGRGMFWSGVGILGGSYLLTSAIGAGVIDSANHLDADDDRNPRDVRRTGQSLMIPIVGPFLAIRHTDSATAAWGSALIGAVQTTGAVLLITGAIKWSRWNRARRWTPYAGGTAHSGHAGMSVRF